MHALAAGPGDHSADRSGLGVRVGGGYQRFEPAALDLSIVLDEDHELAAGAASREVGARREAQVHRGVYRAQARHTGGGVEQRVGRTVERGYDLAGRRLGQVRGQRAQALAEGGRVERGDQDGGPRALGRGQLLSLAHQPSASPNECGIRSVSSGSRYLSGFS